VFRAYAQRFADPGAGVVQKEKQCMISATAQTRSIRLRKNIFDLLGFEILCGRDPRSLARDGQHPLILLCTRQIVLQEMLEEAANRRQANITTARCVGALSFQVREERHDICAL